jgi:hypothetical protein
VVLEEKYPLVEFRKDGGVRTLAQAGFVDNMEIGTDLHSMSGRFISSVWKYVSTERD